MAARIDITIRDNSRWPKTFNFEDQNRNPIDWTGSTFELQVRTSADASDIAATLSTANGRIALSGTPTDGKLIINFPLGVLDPGDYDYDLLRTVGSAEPDTIAFGSVRVVKGVTR